MHSGSCVPGLALNASHINKCSAAFNSLSCCLCLDEHTNNSSGALNMHYDTRWNRLHILPHTLHLDLNTGSSRSNQTSWLSPKRYIAPAASINSYKMITGTLMALRRDYFKVRCTQGNHCPTPTGPSVVQHAQQKHSSKNPKQSSTAYPPVPRPYCSG